MHVICACMQQSMNSGTTAPNTRSFQSRVFNLFPGSIRLKESFPPQEYIEKGFPGSFGSACSCPTSPPSPKAKIPMPKLKNRPKPQRTRGIFSFLKQMQAHPIAYPQPQDRGTIVPIQISTVSSDLGSFHESQRSSLDLTPHRRCIRAECTSTIRHNHKLEPAEASTGSVITT